MNDRELVRDYITAADHLQYTQLADGTVQVNVTHSNLKQYVMELRLDLHTSIAEVKRKLYTHNGTSLEHMELQLRRDGETIAQMLDDERPLGYYGAQNGMEIHVVDRDPYSLSRDGGLDDVSRIEKYRMTEEDYDKRENTLRAWKRKKQEQDPSFRLVPVRGAAPAGPAIDYTDPTFIEGIEVGKRCSVTPGDRRGEVCFVGTVDALAAGFWVGVRLDEPLGKNDGSTPADGKKYFCASAGFGAFVRPNNVAVGDYPPEFDGLDGIEERPASAAAAAAPTNGVVGGGVAATTTPATTTTTTTTTTTAADASAPSTTSAQPTSNGTSAPKGSSRRHGARRTGGDDDDDDDDDAEL